MSDDGFVSCRVTVPDSRLLALAPCTYARLDALIGNVGVYAERDVVNGSTTYVGRAQRSFVTLMMALAQGHDLGPLLDGLEAGEVVAKREDG